jgi:hypothetical protein
MGKKKSHALDPDEIKKLIKNTNLLRPNVISPNG